MVFTSSVAVYGGEAAAAVNDGTALTPETSYGAQKAIGEQLVNDYSRKGFIDGRSLRLPTNWSFVAIPTTSSTARTWTWRCDQCRSTG